MNPDQEALFSNRRDNYLSLNVVSNQEDIPLLSNRGYSLSKEPNIQAPKQRGKIRCFNKCRFSIKTFTFWISMLDVILFLITNQYIKKDNEELEYCILYKFGGKYTPAILTYHHIHRLVLPIFLHHTDKHLMANLLSQLMWGFRLEEALGTRKMIFLYLITGIAGNMMSAVFNPTGLGVGASSAIYGILGFALPYVIISVKDPQNDIIDHLFTLNTIYSLVKSFFSNAPQADNDMHRGGFIVGLLVAGLFIRGSSAMGFDKKNKIAMTSLILIVLYFGILSIALFLMPSYHQEAATEAAKCAKLLGW